VRPLPAAEAYRLWAPSYGPETVVSALDERLVHRLSPPLAGRRLLDAGCGTGRRLASAKASLTAGIDLVPEMLARSVGDVPSASRPHHLALAAADVCAIPFRDHVFDLVWCRLVLGHLPFLPGAYAELARVCRPGGTVIVTDFHPAAVAAGHRRTFRADDGEVREVAHHVHTGPQHVAAAAAAGLRLGLELEEGVGPAVLPFYALAAKTDRYLADLGLPLVLGLRFLKS
jgi:malonyl-CoA O-methyltransferase